MDTHAPVFALFVPADRPERFAKASAAGAGAVIIDLEDAVAPDDKIAARRIPAGALPVDRAAQLWLRVNAIGTPWHDEDVAFARAQGFDGVVLPKASSAAEVTDLRARLASDCAIIALIESAAGLAAARELAVAADRTAFGSIDFARDMGCAHTREMLHPARHEMVLAARLADRPAPLDGVTAATRDTDAVRNDARHASDMGLGGKLLIHPAQIAPARDGFRPDAAQVDWAKRVLLAAEGGGTVVVDGAMVDAPVVALAARILAREALATGDMA